MRTRTQRRREDLEPDELESAAAPAPSPDRLSPLAVQRLQRTIGNHATTRLIQRMSVVDAVAAAKDAGATDEDVETKAESGLRYDPIGKVWVKPADEALWDQFHPLTKRAQFKLTYADWEKKQLEKGNKGAEAKKVLDIDDESALKALWGGAAVFDKWERAAAIKKLFEDGGFETGAATESTTSSSDTPPVLFEIKKHKMIVLFEVHPGGGIHKAPYIRISTNKGMIKVINDAGATKYDKLSESAVRYIDVSIA